MKIVVLASGSEGNVTYIESKKVKILLDFGMSVAYVRDKLKELNVELDSINYIIISHTHSDHVKGLDVLVKHYQPTICLSKEMFEELSYLSNYKNIIIYEQRMSFADINIETIKTSHDAVDSRGFIITINNETVVYLTDTGYINQKYFQKLANKEYYLFESNHDIEKLMNGTYTYWLKQRINDANGHLSNKAASIYLTRLIGNNTKKVILMHISRKNNTEEIALETIYDTLANHNIEFSDIRCARQKEMLEV